MKISHLSNENIFCQMLLLFGNHKEVAFRADVPDLLAGTENAEARPRQEVACRADKERRALMEN